MTKETLESPFPTYEQELLLKASLLNKDIAISAFEEWHGLVDLDAYIDHGSFRLLPLLYRNLLKHGYNGQRMPMLKGIYRQTWCKNQKILYDSASILGDFHKAGFKTLVLKGVPLSVLIYKDIGARPMYDLDILVPSAKGAEAISFLKKNKWEPVEPIPDEYLRFNLRYGKSLGLKNEGGFECDIHWQPFFEAHGNKKKNNFWGKAIPIKVSHCHTLSLCHEDMLLQTILHGINWNIEPPIRWVADAFLIINDKALDWRYFNAQVKKFRVALYVKKAFQYLSEQYGVVIPPETTNFLNNIKITSAEKLVYEASQKDPDDFPDRFIPRLKKYFVLYLQKSKKTYMLFHYFGFIHYLLLRPERKNYIKNLLYYLKKLFKLH